jgi:hypothetical protein
MKISNEGWCIDVTSRGRTHYYKDGVSLCGEAREKHFFTNFNKDEDGYAFSKDCKYCIKKLKQLKK